MSSKILVIGLDGATWDLLDPWINQGKMPNLTKLIKNGVKAQLMSTLPLGTAAAWSSIVTGKNPGKHGIYEFMARKEGSYDLIPLNSSFRRSKDIWSILEESGKEVVVVNVPFTYPPRKINGIMITGMMTPQGEEYVYPPSLKKELEEIGYTIDLKEAYAEGKEDVFLEGLLETLEKRTKTVLHLMEKVDWGFFFVVFTGTDRIQHAFWEYMDSDHPAYTQGKGTKYGDAILNYYEKVDGVVGEIVKKAGENTNIFVMSDHGMGPLYRWVHLNNLLRKLGLLKLKKDVPTLVKRFLYHVGINPLNAYRLLSKLNLGGIPKKAGRAKTHRLLRLFFLSLNNIDWPKTRAYSTMGTGQVFINLKGREPKGIVDPQEEYDQLREKIATTLRQFRDPERNTEVCEYIAKKKDIYEGPCFEEAPDLVFLPAIGYETFPEYSFATGALVTPPFGISATHRMNGILIMKGPFFKKRIEMEDVRLVDVAPTILYLLGIPIPQDMDGKILYYAVDPNFQKEHVATEVETSTAIEKSRYVYSKDEEEKIKKRLIDLGYL